MMPLAAEEVATTLAGELIVYVIFPLFVAAMIGAIAIAFRFNRRQSSVELALAVSNRSLAVVIETLTGNGQALVAQADDIDKLETATALLKDRMDRHDTWVQQESAKLERRLEQQRGALQ